MSSILLLNFEDFGLTQDITKTIQPHKQFCICCLERNGPMVDLVKCAHKDYLDTFGKTQLQQFNQLVCLQCHNILKKIKSFQTQVLESYSILLSGTFTNATVNLNRLNSLIVQKVVDDLHLPPDSGIAPENYDKQSKNTKDKYSQQIISQNIEKNYTQELNNEEDIIYDENQFNIQENYGQGIIDVNDTHGIKHTSLEVNSSHGINDSSLDNNYTDGIRDGPNIEENYTDEISDSINLDENYTQEMKNNTHLGENYTQEMRDNTHLEENYTQEMRDNTHLGENYTQEMRDNTHLGEIYTQEMRDNTHLGENYTQEMRDNTHLGENYTHGIRDSSLEESYTHGIKENFIHQMENSSNLQENFTHISNVQKFTQQNNTMNIELNKNIKNALDILERNNQSFVTLGSQLQFLNGEHLSFLEPSLLSKEMLTDIPLVPGKSINTDLENALLHNSKSLDIEIDGPDKMFYDSLDLSPVLMKESNLTDMIKIEMNEPEIQTNKKMDFVKPSKVRKMKKQITPVQVKIVKLSQEQLNKERVLQAQSDAYLRHKFRCETCLIGFNYRENLEDHSKRKHGVTEAENVICDICSQVVPSIGGMTEHNYRHFTRYECPHCKRRYHTRDEAVQHCYRKLCGRDQRNCLNSNPPAQRKQSRLKQKYVRA